MERQDWVLLAIVFGKNPLTPAQLQKSLFLLGENFSALKESDFYSFIPYNYGPFDVAIYTDAEKLEEEKKIIREFLTERDWPKYSPTEIGREEAKSIIQEAGEEEVAFLKEAVAWTQSLSFQDLIRAIYQYFPKYKENSIFSG